MVIPPVLLTWISWAVRSVFFWRNWCASWSYLTGVFFNYWRRLSSVHYISLTVEDKLANLLFCWILSTNDPMSKDWQPVPMWQAILEWGDQTEEKFYYRHNSVINLQHQRGIKSLELYDRRSSRTKAYWLEEASFRGGSYKGKKWVHSWQLEAYVKS